MSATLQVGELIFAVQRSSRRKTVEIGVERDGSLVLRAPAGLDESRLARFAADKRMWVYQKLAAREALVTTAPHREFVTGEGFLYLGRSYRLLLVDHQSAPLRLAEGRFQLRRADVPRAREHFIAWYARNGEPWLRRRTLAWAPRLGVEIPEIQVRDLGFRWGSCGTDGRLYFHWRTITLPAAQAEYVVVHELAHLRYPHHGPEFWAAMARAMPDHEARKRWLAEQGGGYGL